MRGMIEQTWDWDEAWQQEDFNRRFTEYTVSIIENAGRATGGLLLESKPDSIYIHEVQVSPEYQGLGIGSAVVQWISTKPTLIRTSALRADRREQRGELESRTPKSRRAPRVLSRKSGREDR
jgi:GNAT superfamily N-acetyltransferase